MLGETFHPGPSSLAAEAPVPAVAAPPRPRSPVGFSGLTDLLRPVVSRDIPPRRCSFTAAPSALTLQPAAAAVIQPAEAAVSVRRHRADLAMQTIRPGACRARLPAPFLWRVSLSCFPAGGAGCLTKTRHTGGALNALHQGRPGELRIDRPVLRGPRFGSADRPDPRLPAERTGLG